MRPSNQPLQNGLWQNALVGAVDARLARLQANIVSFFADKRGNVAIITALTCLPLVTAAGCVIDYTSATLVKTKLLHVLTSLFGPSPSFVATAVTRPLLDRNGHCGRFYAYTA